MRRNPICFSRWILGLACWCLALPSAAMAAPAPKPARAAASRRFEFTYTVLVPAARGRRLRLWVPLPHSDRYQTISRLAIRSPVPYRVQRGAGGNLDAFFRFAGARLRKPAEIRIRFLVLRRKRAPRLPAGDSPAPRPVPPAMAAYLRPARMIPLGGIIARLSAQATRGASSPLEKARRIYEYVVAHMRYDKSGAGWGRGDAVWACTSHRGNCTDFHSLFIGMARAAGIPARFKIGFPLPQNRRRGAIPGYHCWAEFYLRGAGWVPIDASEAWLDPARHDFYFGALDPDRVMFTAGRDVRLAPPQHSRPLNFFIYPYAELDGKPFASIRSRFRFRDIPAR